MVFILVNNFKSLVPEKLKKKIILIRLCYIKLFKLINKNILKPVIKFYFKYWFDNTGTNNNLICLEKRKFIDAYSCASSATKIKLDNKMRIHQALWCAKSALKLKGDIVELGCGAGFTFYSILKYLDSDDLGWRKSKKVYLYDSFIPVKPNLIDGSQVQSNELIQNPTAYSSSFSNVCALFSQWENVKITEGRLPEILQLSHNYPEQISFLHIDLNHYKAEIESLNVLWINIVQGGFILLDDYANPGRDKQRLAFDEFFTKFDLEILTLVSGQGLVIKN